MLLYKFLGLQFHCAVRISALLPSIAEQNPNDIGHKRQGRQGDGDGPEDAEARADDALEGYTGPVQHGHREDGGDKTAGEEEHGDDGQSLHGGCVVLGSDSNEFAVAGDADGQKTVALGDDIGELSVSRRKDERQTQTLTATICVWTRCWM